MGDVCTKKKTTKKTSIFTHLFHWDKSHVGLSSLSEWDRMSKKENHRTSVPARETTEDSQLVTTAPCTLSTAGSEYYRLTGFMDYKQMVFV